MSRNLSDVAMTSINNLETAEVWLAMVKLTHPDWTDSIRLVRNTEDVQSNGEVYSQFPFDVSLPDEEAEQTAVVSWVAMNVGAELIAAFRAVSGPIDGEIFWVLASNPDLIEIGPLELQMRGFEYDAATIKGSMVIEPVLDAVFGHRNMDTGNAPGLF